MKRKYERANIDKIDKNLGVALNIIKPEKYPLNLMRIMPPKERIHMLSRYLEHLKTLSLFEIMTTAVVSVVLGVSMWGWTLVYDLFKIFLDATPFNYLTSGFWVIPGLFLPFIIRKPGIALLASIVASFVQGLITQWGLSSVVYGFIQGFAAEIIFFVFGFKRMNMLVLVCAGFLSAALSYSYDYLKYGYSSLGQIHTIIQLCSFMISTIPFAVIPTILLSKKLLKTGLLHQFSISKHK